MEYIYMTPSARCFFELKGIGLDYWNIPQPEKDRIKDHHVCVAVFSAPASALDLQINPDLRNMNHLIILDKGPLKNGSITSEQQVAILLHEIGHIVNPAPAGGDYSSELDEQYADDYVRYCGYGNDFVTALSKMKDLDVPEFNSSSVDTRILRLQGDTAPRLNLQNG